MAAGLLAATATQRPLTGRLEGIALSYGITAQLDGFSEEFAAGAFRNLDDPAILLVAEHNPERLLARTGAGTLRFDDSPTHLRYSASLPATEEGRSAHTLAARSDYAGVSVGFRVLPGGEQWRRGGRHRIVTAAALDHLSPVARPAHNTTINARHHQGGLDPRLEIRNATLIFAA